MFFLDKPNAGKPTFILFKVCLKGGERFVYSTGEKIDPQHWSKEAGCPKAMRGEVGIELSYIAARIKQIEKAYTEIVRIAKLSATPLTRLYLKQELDRKVNGIDMVKTDLVSIINRHIESRTNDPTFGYATHTRYKNLAKLISEFDSIHSHSTTIADITKEWYFNFLNYLFEEKKYLDNTAGGVISKLKCVVNWAKRQKIVSGEIADSATYNLVTISRETDKVSLTYQEILSLEALSLPADSTQEKVRDLFLIGCYSGQRFSDYSVFDKSEYRNGIIHKVADKTEFTSYIPVDDNPPLKRLLEKYRWKLPKISNQKFNDYIKEVARAAKINTPVKQTSFRGKEKIEYIQPKYKLISSHTGRRTFITLGSQNAMDQRSMMSITGIRKVDTLIKYNKVSEQGIREQISRFLDGLKKATPKKKGGSGT